MKFLASKDRDERFFMNAVALAADEAARQRDERRAYMIADAVGKRLLGK